MSATIDLTNAKPCPDCRRMLTTEPKCCHCTERDQLRAEIAAAKEEQIATLTELQSFCEHTTALAADNARLRKALETIADDGIERSRDPRTVIAQAALSATPAQSLAAHDAALLREVAGGVDKIAVVPTIDTPQSMRDLIADAIRAKADRMGKETPHA